MYALTNHSAGSGYQVIEPPNDGRKWDVVAMSQSLSSSGNYGTAIVTILWKTDDA